MLDKEELRYLLALGLIPGIGQVLTRFLVSYAGSPSKVFQLKAGKLLKVPKVGEKIAKAILQADTLATADEEIAWCEKQGITILSYLDEGYPKRLAHCQDAPVILYYKGNANLNNERVVNIIGTRHATEHGKAFTEKLIAGLQPYQPLIVSGLALGIDIAAHKAAIQMGLPTVGVLGHGLDMIYPWQNRQIASRMPENGGLLTEFPKGTKPDRQNFPMRNRIVAGMCDATILIESAESGGAMITADIALSYNRDVFAVPGRPQDEYALGCLQLIRQNKAQLITSADDVAIALGWQAEPGLSKREEMAIQRSLFEQLEEPESTIVNCMVRGEMIELDKLHYLCNLPLSILSSALLALEFKGLVSSHPGKRYRLV
jgi:DNA processing protein